MDYLPNLWAFQYEHQTLFIFLKTCLQNKFKVH